MKEVDIFGVYVAPFAAYMVWSFVIFIPVRMWLDRVEVQKWVWHRSLFDVAVYVIILSLVGLIF